MIHSASSDHYSHLKFASFARFWKWWRKYRHSCENSDQFCESASWIKKQRYMKLTNLTYSFGKWLPGCWILVQRSLSRFRHLASLNHPCATWCNDLESSSPTFQTWSIQVRPSLLLLLLSSHFEDLNIWKSNQQMTRPGLSAGLDV